MLEAGKKSADWRYGAFILNDQLAASAIEIGCRTKINRKWSYIASPSFSDIQHRPGLSTKFNSSKRRDMVSVICFHNIFQNSFLPEPQCFCGGFELRKANCILFGYRFRRIWKDFGNKIAY